MKTKKQKGEAMPFAQLYQPEAHWIEYPPPMAAVGEDLVAARQYESDTQKGVPVNMAKALVGSIFAE